MIPIPLRLFLGGKTCLDFPIFRFHVNTPTIFLLTNPSFVKTKCFQWRKINYIYKGCTWFSMISTSMDMRTDMRKRTTWHSKKSQIGVWNRPSCQWNTIFKTTITKNDTFFTYVDVNISKYLWEPAQMRNRCAL